MKGSAMCIHLDDMLTYATGSTNKPERDGRSGLRRGMRAQLTEPVLA